MNMYQERKRNDLINTCAEICCFAQDHSGDQDAWGPRNSPDLHYMMQHTSYTIACFLAQNTKDGSEGVEWEIVLDQLCGPVLDLEQWKTIFENLVEEFGGPKYGDHYKIEV